MPSSQKRPNKLQHFLERPLVEPAIDVLAPLFGLDQASIAKFLDVMRKGGRRDVETRPHITDAAARLLGDLILADWQAEDSGRSATRCEPKQQPEPLRAGKRLENPGYFLVIVCLIIRHTSKYTTFSDLSSDISEKI